MSFPKAFPATAALLDGARHDVFPDYAVGVSIAGTRHFGFGGCGADSLFDLASLTKVICTTTVALLAESRGALSIDRPVLEYFPAFSDPAVKLSHLLDHSSGLPAWLPLHAQRHGMHPLEARAQYEAEILAVRPGPPGVSSVYSDLGFLLLGWALEKAAGAPLDALFQEWFATPSELESLQFLPTSPDVVPTENCPWRGRVLRGEVHDDNCFVLGGVAGHAGLFGNARDVLAAGLLWLDAYKERSSPLPAGLTRKYWTFTHVKGGTRVLGWDTVSQQGSATGRRFSPSSRGHLGFTGTSLWIDPERELVVALLTNRVHPTRDNEKIKAFRPVFHDSLMTELGFAR
jgi:CubicO group peptidase (beta-lactamase class C family)